MKWRCSVCNYEISGETAPIKCPVCAASMDKFTMIDSAKQIEAEEQVADLHHYLGEWTRPEYEDEEKYSLIHKMAITGKSDISPMGTRKPFPGMDTVLFRGTQFTARMLN